jgi:hypothetical protein
MNEFWVSEGQLTAEQEKSYGESNKIFVSVVTGLLADRLQDVYLHHKTHRDMWDALNANYRGLDAGTKLYIIEQYRDYKMVDGRNMVE